MTFTFHVLGSCVASDLLYVRDVMRDHKSITECVIIHDLSYRWSYAGSITVHVYNNYKRLWLLCLIIRPRRQSMHWARWNWPSVWNPLVNVGIKCKAEIHSGACWPSGHWSKNVIKCPKWPHRIILHCVNSRLEGRRSNQQRQIPNSFCDNIWFLISCEGRVLRFT